MNKIGVLAFLLVLGVLVVVTVSKYQSAPGSAHAETAYERVIRTGTLRCGYEYWDSAVMKDANGQLYGAWVDILNEIGQATGLKVEWVAQVGWGEVSAALKSSKIDAMCAGMWQSAIKAKEIAFSIPLAYQGIEAFVRTDDARFESNLSRIDSDDINIMVIDNDNSDFIARSDFPKAKRVALGQLNGTDAELMMGVMTRKADVTFTVTGLWRQFEKNNPGKVRRIDPGHYLRVFGLALAVDNADLRLLQMLNVAAQEISNSGAVDRVLRKYDTDFPDMYLRGTKPFVP